jgi:hypothetical protein
VTPYEYLGLPEAKRQSGFEYPLALEEAVMRYVAEELVPLRLD